MVQKKKSDRKGLLNYSTSIDPNKTANEIQTILAKHGASAILCDYGPNGSITSLSFKINTPNGERGIRLPSNAAPVYQILRNQVNKGLIRIKDLDTVQAERVAWRILKDWVEAQMAILETQMVEMDQIFLPYMISKNNQTFFEAYKNNQLTIGGVCNAERDNC